MAATIVGLVCAGEADADAPRVVASIKPLHALVAGVMDGVGEPALLIDGIGSPHAYSLRPSDARALNSADLVVWIGAGMESFLAKPLASLPQATEIIEAAMIDGTTLLPLRVGGVWETHDHPPKLHGDEDGHTGATEIIDAGSTETLSPEHANLHLWLDPGNARAIIAAIAEALARIDPSNADVYAVNADRRMKEIEAMDRVIDGLLAPVKTRSFLVFHDAYRYFEDRYDLSVAGSVTVSPDHPPGAHRISTIRDRLKAGDVVCVLIEPQFPRRIVETIVAGMPVRIGTADPLGADIQAGPEAYTMAMMALAESLSNCLALEQ
ncbi:MAG: zinc ABC transporter solute-binding protein [Alphaproteobacteria bacterium]|nr:zinc ABC transporter solute-binding protein [Alphaproteobacteria bacterium]